jgi:DNA-binding NarL/FixJ family response regulator
MLSRLAQGFSNRDIAGKLTMSVRTVEGHLNRASQRLGIGSRDELGALMRDFDP